MHQILNYWRVLHVHWSPAQLSVSFLKRPNFGSCFMLSSKAFQRKLPLNDTDYTSYDIAHAKLAKGLFYKIIFRTGFLMKFQYNPWIHVI